MKKKTVNFFLLIYKFLVPLSQPMHILVVLLLDTTRNL